MKTATVLVLVALIAMEMDKVCALTISPGRLQKPGACPKMPTLDMRTCLEQCSTVFMRICLNRCSGDESCPNKKKCCRFGCGRVCMPPIFK
ncbi:WAP four-disulfide core domain protein 18-like [Phodopus roborovskii]|uniref:WAP four-disulfide core domain protein 18-like n=1 Tax=Phodopus roborovskii TaxID=109678 RepID=UPI0021E3C90F|nr:WAP four-disulfide core domain protein 18-like [Phodopus roborovskii]